MPQALCPRRKKIIYRCHYRGTREADLVLGPWAAANAPLWPEADLAMVEAFLDQQDPDIYDWLVGAVLPPAQFATIIQQLQNNHA